MYPDAIPFRDLPQGAPFRRCPGYPAPSSVLEEVYREELVDSSGQPWHPPSCHRQRIVRADGRPTLWWVGPDDMVRAVADQLNAQGHEKG